MDGLDWKKAAAAGDYRSGYRGGHWRRRVTWRVTSPGQMAAAARPSSAAAELSANPIESLFSDVQRCQIYRLKNDQLSFWFFFSNWIRLLLHRRGTWCAWISFFFVFVFLFFDFVLFVVFGWFRHATPAICYSPLAFISGVITGYGRRRKIKEEVINEIKPNTWNECTCVCVCVCVCVCSSYKQTAMPDVENADAFNWSKKRQPTVMCYAILQFLLTGDFPMQIRPATQSGGSGESKYANFISENRSSSLLNGSRFQRNFLKKFKEDKLNWWEWAERKCGNAVRRTET